MIIVVLFLYSIFIAWGNRLLYLNSILGYFISKTYRFTIIACIILLIVDLCYCSISIKKRIPRSDVALMKKTEDTLKKQLACPACGSNKAEGAIYCGECGCKF